MDFLDKTGLSHLWSKIVELWNRVTHVIEQNHGNEQQVWVGLKAEYDAIETKDPHTLYVVTDETGTSTDGNYVTLDQLDEKLKAKADVSHTHTAADVGAYSKAETDAKLCNPNLLDNWYFGNPVNTLGKTEYAGSGTYTIDRWLLQYDTNLNIVDGGVKLSKYWSISQFFTDTLPNATYTLSLLYKDKTGTDALRLGAANRTSGDILVKDTTEESGLISLTVSTDLLNHVFIGFSGNADNAVLLIAVKLELGDTQTLAHQDNSGNWVLNEISNKEDTLARCSQYDPDTGAYKGILFAPDGYGLGGIAKRLSADDDIDQVFLGGWYVWFDPKPQNAPYTYCAMRVDPGYSTNGGYAIQTIYAASQNYVLQRRRIDSSWRDFVTLTDKEYVDTALAGKVKISFYNDNLDTLYSDGHYRLGGNVTGGPSAASSSGAWGQVDVVSGTTTDACVQTLTDMSGKIFCRRIQYANGASITEWQRILTQSDLSHSHSGQTLTPLNLELGAGASGHGGFIDFHYNGDYSKDYTSRIIESVSGRLSLTATNGVEVTNPAIDSYRARNIAATTTDLSAGSSSLTTGAIYLVYE